MATKKSALVEVVPEEVVSTEELAVAEFVVPTVEETPAVEEATWLGSPSRDFFTPIN